MNDYEEESSMKETKGVKNWKIGRNRDEKKGSENTLGWVTSWVVRRWRWPVMVVGTRKVDGGCAKCEERRTRVQSSTGNQILDGPSNL